MLTQIFILAAVCYIIHILSERLDITGGRLGYHLHLPDEIVASTFQALATSGPEIFMAIIAATPFITQNIWSTLTLQERACSGTLNMAFSAMDNLLGIGAVAIVFMIVTGRVNPNEHIKPDINTCISLFFYTFISYLFYIMSLDHQLTYVESWTLMAVGILFVIVEIVRSYLMRDKDSERKEVAYVIKKKPIGGSIWSLIQYSFLIFALIVFVKIAMSATFNMALISSFSVGGILLLFTSYISSFPEFVLSFKYAIENRKEALLGMLFGSNIIDLSFAGFRSIWLHETMSICTTGRYPWLLPYYLAFLPIVSIILVTTILTGFLKWKHSYFMILFYLIYIVSGFILL